LSEFSYIKINQLWKRISKKSIKIKSNIPGKILPAFLIKDLKHGGIIKSSAAVFHGRSAEVHAPFLTVIT